MRIVKNDDGLARMPATVLADVPADVDATDLESSPASVRGLVSTLRESNKRLDLEMQLAACEAQHKAGIDVAL